MTLRVLLVVVLSVVLVGCGPAGYAPVVDAWTSPTAQSSGYRVKKGDTLYSIAWAFGLDFRALAAANNLRSPYEIEPGQVLRMTTTARGQAPKASTRPTPTQPAATSRRRTSSAKPVQRPKVYRTVNAPVGRWRWPARGKIVERFSWKPTGNKGIDIAGRLGSPVRASGPGVVVYSGDGVRGYGNLLIIKHNDSYLSAYAFNQRMLVKVGARVRANQPIATMGRNNAGRVMLHFEIRRNGRPVDPMRYLK